MRDHDDRRAAVHRSGKGTDERCFAVAVEEGVGLVENQQYGLTVEGAGQRNSLRLAGRQAGAERTERRVIAFRKLQDQLMRARGFCGFDRQCVDVFASDRHRRSVKYSA